MGIQRLVGSDRHGIIARYLRSVILRGKPAVEAVTFSGGNGQIAVSAGIGHRLACCRTAAAVGIEGDSIGVRRPLGSEGQRSLAHGLGDLRLPARKGVARAGDGGSLDLLAIGAGGGSALAAVGVPGQCMRVVEEGQLIGDAVLDIPICGIGQHHRHFLAVQRRDGCAGAGDARLIRNSNHDRHLIHAGRFLTADLDRHRLMIAKQSRQELHIDQIERRIILIDKPDLDLIAGDRNHCNPFLVLNEQFVCRANLAGDLSLQLCLRIRPDRSNERSQLLAARIFLRSAELRIITAGNLQMFALKIRKGIDQVQIAGPLGLDDHILRGHGGGDRLVPAVKTIARLGRILGRGDGRAVILRDGRDHAAAVGVKGDGVLVLFPSIHIVDPSSGVAGEGGGDKIESQLSR